MDKSASRKKAATVSVEDEVVSTFNLGPSHYGLHYVIRHWVSYAISRRSFSLLAKASGLAKKCGITMDEILSGENHFTERETGTHREMLFLQRIMLTPARNQQTSGGPLSLAEVPTNLLQAINCCPDVPNHNPDNRWINIREMKEGTSRFYASHAFQRDIMSWSVMNETWNANEIEVKDLWTPAPERIKYAQALIHQFSLHNQPGMPPSPTRTASTRIQLLTKEIVEVECVICLAIVSLDQAFVFVESFIPPTAQKQQGMSSRDNSSSSATDPIRSEDREFWTDLEQFEWTGELEDLFKL